MPSAASLPNSMSRWVTERVGTRPPPPPPAIGRDMAGLYHRPGPGPGLLRRRELDRVGHGDLGLLRRGELELADLGDHAGRQAGVADPVLHDLDAGELAGRRRRLEGDDDRAPELAVGLERLLVAGLDGGLAGLHPRGDVGADAGAQARLAAAGGGEGE